MTGKKRPQFQGVTVFDADEEYITSAVAERKGMNLFVYAHVPANPSLDVHEMYSIRSTTPGILMQGVFQSEADLVYVFSGIQIGQEA